MLDPGDEARLRPRLLALMASTARPSEHAGGDDQEGRAGVRLRRRKQNAKDDGRRAQAAEHRSPPAALTRWLRQGFSAGICPLCRVAHKADRDDHLRKNTTYLVDLLATSPGDRAKFESSPGLCFEHFKLAWDAAPSLADRELLLKVQRSAAGSLLDELREHVRKHDHKFSHEAKGPERDSWQRAIYLTAGWP